jgi:single-strand DNA-binding protein
MFLGGLCADPDLRFGQNGGAVLKLRLACSERYKGKDDKWAERVEYVNVTVFGKRGEALANILRKGEAVFVEGSLRTSSYDNREGVKTWRTEIVASNVILTGNKPGGRGAPRDEQPAQEPPADDAAQGDGYGGDDDIHF